MPSSRKGVCARHTSDVARFFRVSTVRGRGTQLQEITVCVSVCMPQGAHVTINARSEMDLEEATIKDKVSKASGEFVVHGQGPIVF